jgi:ubiquinone/menaquinone biosynthesis C-methylase UbiE
MDIRIEHCTVCWGYRDRALALAEELRNHLGATVEIVGGSLGQFDVRVDGRLISSRGDSLLARIKPPRLPSVADVVAAIEREKLGPRHEAPPHEQVRDQFSPEDAKRFYDRFGSWQDAQFYERAALKYLVARSDFEHARAVFEWGCGTGRFAEFLLKNHLPQDANYMGIDISTTMIRIATHRLVNWSGRARVQRADGTARLSYAKGAFDRFVATYVFDLLSEADIAHVVGEACRLLRPNGKLCVVSSTEGITPVSRAVSSIWKSLYAFDPRLVGGCRPLCVSMLLDRTVWNIEHDRVVCSWGICSEVVVASPT